MKKLIERLRQYSESLVAYKLGADFADAVCRAANAIENLQTENAALRRQIDSLTDAQAVMVREFEAKLEELHEAKSELNAMRNELCYKCGNYEQAHNGWCDHCRWKKEA